MRHKRFVSWGAAVLVGMVAAVVAGAAPASAAPTSNAWGYWRNHHAWKYMSLDVGYVGANGEHGVQFDYYGTTDQQWQWSPSRYGGYFYLRNAVTWKVLGIGGASKDNGAHAVIWSWNDSPDQRWKAVPSSAYPGWYFLQNQHSGKCLGVSAADTRDGAHLVQWTCGNEDHLWQVREFA